MTAPVIVVVGGGPAGSSAATAAAEQGCDVVLLERGGSDRDKACGDALVHEALPELDSLGIELDPLGGRQVRTLLLANEKGDSWTRDFAGDCWMIRRRILDSSLRERAAAAGADVRHHMQVTRLMRPKQGDAELAVVVTPTGSDDHPGEVIRADAVILAHGAASKLSTQCGLEGAPLRAPAVTRYVEDTAPQDALCFTYSSDPKRPGYFWAFPDADGGCNAGIFATTRTTLRTRLTSERGDVRWRGGYETLWSGLGKIWHDDDGVVSCGDAAGVVDPLTGEGIGPALLTGRFAGVAAAQYAHDRGDTLARYSDWLRGWASNRFQPIGRRALLAELLYPLSQGDLSQEDLTQGA